MSGNKEEAKSSRGKIVAVLNDQLVLAEMSQELKPAEKVMVFSEIDLQEKKLDNGLRFIKYPKGYLQVLLKQGPGVYLLSLGYREELKSKPNNLALQISGLASVLAGTEKVLEKTPESNTRLDTSISLGIEVSPLVTVGDFIEKA